MGGCRPACPGEPGLEGEADGVCRSGRSARKKAASVAAIKGLGRRRRRLVLVRVGVEGFVFPRVVLCAEANKRSWANKAGVGRDSRGLGGPPGRLQRCCQQAVRRSLSLWAAGQGEEIEIGFSPVGMAE